MFAANHLAYNQTASFSKIVTDYLRGAEALRSFYDQPPTFEGIKAKLNERKEKKTDRELLVNVLQQQYKGLVLSAAVQKNIESLLQPNTFTVTTAHQPNLFTGPLYFIYKILHVIKLTETLKQQLLQTILYRFITWVPRMRILQN